ncbi:MAG: hypothetical protein Q8R44_15385 [Novosphingobium sp.]|nr:hypothetical protein [Novosphingobium sp.]
MPPVLRYRLAVRQAPLVRLTAALHWRQALTRPGVVTILRRRIFEAIDLGLVDFEPGREGETVPALSAHSFRVGLTRDLFAADKDGAGIALALRYARELAGSSNAAKPSAIADRASQADLSSRNGAIFGSSNNRHGLRFAASLNSIPSIDVSGQAVD